MKRTTKPSDARSDSAFLSRLVDSAGFNSVAASGISIVLGLIFGFIVILFIDATSAANGMGDLLTYGFSSLKQVAKVLYKTAPLLMTGLAVGFAFRAGLFNIGATGQYTVGAFFALYVAILWHFPWWAATLVAMVAGTLWGSIPGLFKAYFNVNEVITSIMFNWIALFLCNLIFLNNQAMWTNSSDSSRSIGLAFVNPSALLPTLGLDVALDSPYANIGIFIAILVAVVVFIVLEKTTFGYEVKACGLNKNAGVYAGIKAKRNIVLSMMIAGGLAGIGGALSHLAGTVNYTISANTLLPMGFNGIPVALLAFSHPLGIIASALLIGFLQVGGEAMQPEFSSEMVNIILSVIIYFSAFSLIMRNLVKRMTPKSRKKAAAGPSDPASKGVDA